MKMDKMRLYHKLPSFLKMVAATIWGAKLHWWRYGEDTERLVEEILERDYWSDAQWANYREKQLEFILHRAATQVPFYRNYWCLRKQHGDNSSHLLLENWPLLTKEDVRTNPEAFVADDCNIDCMYKDHTGGTTGTPLTIYKTRKTIQLWYAMTEARMRRWHGVSYKDRWAIFGGQLVVPLDQQNPPFWVESKILNQLYLSTFHISKKNISHYAKKINQFRPSHIIVYPSSATEFAKIIISEGVDIWSPKVIFSNAEPISDQQRALISTAFKCRVVNTYGMGESVYGASECEFGVMHSWLDSGVLEIFSDDKNGVRGANSGSFFITGLINSDMPLIRYEIGDRGEGGKQKFCKCGRTLSTLGNIDGRTSDLIMTPDGRKIFWLNSVFYELPISQAQIIQDSFEKVKVKIVPAERFGPSDIACIRDRLQQRIGEKMKVTIDLVETIEREENGKIRSVISRLN